VAIKAEYLLAFCRAAKLGSISKAAKTIGVSQPAISRQLQCLQNETGEKLYTRNAQGIELTAYGTELLAYACKVSQTLTEAKNFISGQSGTASSLKLGLSKHLVPSLTMPLLNNLKAYNSNRKKLTLDLIENYSRNLLEQILTDRLDAAYLLTTLDNIPTDLIKLDISEESICLFALPDDPILRSENISLSVLDGETLIIPSKISTISGITLKALEAESSLPGRILEVSGPGAVKDAVRGGLGIGISLESFLKQEVDAGWLRCAPLKNPKMKLTKVLVCSNAESISNEMQTALVNIAT